MDKYDNLVFLNSKIHILIHATQPETISYYLNLTKLTENKIKKDNEYRIIVGNDVINYK